MRIKLVVNYLFSESIVLKLIVQLNLGFKS